MALTSCAPKAWLLLCILVPMKQMWQKEQLHVAIT